MAFPRIVRARTDSPLLPITVGGTIAGLVLGWFLGAWIFKPARLEALPDGTGEGDDSAAVEPDVRDASALAAPRDAGPPALVVPVNLHVGLLSACGDGEEMDLLGSRCDAPAGLEPALRAHLLSALGRCPAAL